MSISNLSKRQKEAFTHIQAYIKLHGYPPRLDELGKLMMIDSISAVHKHVVALKEKGVLKYEPKSTRSISVFEENGGFKEIPLVGKISAGAGIEPIENPEPIKVSIDLLPGTGSHFALKVSGDSMVDDGIHDGDVVVIRSQSIAQNGDTVVAIMNNGNELATLKKFYMLNDKIELRAANSRLKDWPRQFEVGEIEIRGKFCGLIRRAL